MFNFIDNYSVIPVSSGVGMVPQWQLQCYSCE